MPTHYMLTNITGWTVSNVSLAKYVVSGGVLIIVVTNPYLSGISTMFAGLVGRSCTKVPNAQLTSLFSVGVFFT